MSRLDEMIYHLDVQAKMFDGFVMKNIQVVEGKDRPCCMVCGNCPSAQAEWLREIKKELQANTKPESKLAKSSEKIESVYEH